MQEKQFEFNPKTRVKGEERQIFDPVRKEWFVLTPEEFVRQFYISLLSEQFSYPISWMRCEVEVKGAGRKKRADLIVYNQQGLPFMVCEFKAMDVPVNEETVFQAARYNRDLNARYVLVANGKIEKIIKLDDITGKQSVVMDFPPLKELQNS